MDEYKFAYRIGAIEDPPEKALRGEGSLLRSCYKQTMQGEHSNTMVNYASPLYNKPELNETVMWPPEIDPGRDPR